MRTIREGVGEAKGRQGIAQAGHSSRETNLRSLLVELCLESDDYHDC